MDAKWISISERPDFDHQPMRQFVLVEGWREHSGVRWKRIYPGTAYIAKQDQIDGYRRSDIQRLCEDGDIDTESVEVTHWMPCQFPEYPITSSSAA